MWKTEYIGDVIYFDTFEEMARYYNHEECEDEIDLQKALEEEQCGMAYPIITEVK